MLKIHDCDRKRLLFAVSRMLAVLMAVVVVAAACDAQAQNDDENDDAAAENDDDATYVAPDAEVVLDGSTFRDDFRAEYRLKYEESDYGTDDSDDPQPRETFERLVNDGSNIHIVSLAFPSEENGEISGVDWHTHPGPVLVGVAEGALTLTWETDCEPRTYEAGEAFVDLGEELHIAENLTDDETVVYITAIGIPDGEPVTDVVVDEEGFEEPC